MNHKHGNPNIYLVGPIAGKKLAAIGINLKGIPAIKPYTISADKAELLIHGGTRKQSTSSKTELPQMEGGEIPATEQSTFESLAKDISEIKEDVAAIKKILQEKIERER